MKNNEFRKIPFSPPDITEEEIDEVVDTLRSGWITTGPKTKLFEKKIAEYCNTEKAVCLNSATACMEMVLRLYDIGPGDEVITSAYTYTASASIIHHVGAKIVLVDTAKDSYHMDYEALNAAITENTKAIIPVDIAGIMCDYDRVLEIVESKKAMFKANSDLQENLGRVLVMADAAHSFGATNKGRKSGEVADFTCFSFHAVKNITTAEGGALTWNPTLKLDNEAIYKHFMLLSLHGQSKDALAKTKAGAWEYDIVLPAYKCNMTDIMASIGLIQLKRYPELLKERRELINLYNNKLKNLDVSVLNHFSDKHESSGHLYFVGLTGKDEQARNTLITSLAEQGISTNVHYKPLPMHTAYKNKGLAMKDYPNAFEMYSKEITLPLHTMLGEEEVEYITRKFKKELEL